MYFVSFINKEFSVLVIVHIYQSMYLPNPSDTSRI